MDPTNGFYHPDPTSVLHFNVRFIIIHYLYVRLPRTYIRFCDNMSLQLLKFFTHILHDKSGSFPPSIMTTHISLSRHHHIHTLFTTPFIVLCPECYTHNTPLFNLYTSRPSSPSNTHQYSIPYTPPNPILLKYAVLLFTRDFYHLKYLFYTLFPLGHSQFNSSVPTDYTTVYADIFPTHTYS